MLFVIIVSRHLVFAACAACEHNAVSKSVWKGGAEYAFDNEDDFIAFKEELAAYTTQQEFYETLSDEQIAELHMVLA